MTVSWVRVAHHSCPPSPGKRCRRVSPGTGTGPSSTGPRVSPSTAESPGLGICLFPAWADFPGLRLQLSILSLSLVLPSFHPIFPGVLTSVNIWQSSPEGSVPIVPGCPPLMPPCFGDSAWKPGQSRVPCGSTVGRGAGQRGEGRRDPKGLFTEQSNEREKQQMRRAEERNS